MLSIHWRSLTMAGLFALPLVSGAGQIEIQFTDFETNQALAEANAETWDSYITRTSDQDCDTTSCDLGGCDGVTGDATGCGGLFGGCGDRLGLGRSGSGCNSAVGCDFLVNNEVCAAIGCDTGLFGLGISKRSDHAFDDFISPTTNPIFFEDPRSLTEVRFLFLHNNLPAFPGAGINKSNSLQVYAAQVRVRLTERLSLIATKDGFIYSQSPLIEEGFADVAAGLKYNFYRDPVAGRLFSGGFTYEIPLGTEASQQGNGDGEFNFFLTGATRFGKRMHFITAGGLREPIDSLAENRLWYWSSHIDYRVANLPLYAFTEGTWYHYASSGNAFPLAVEGLDLLNLGSPGVTGNDIVTRAVGLKYKPRNNVELGGAYEIPVTSRQGIMLERWTFDAIFRY